MNRRFERILIGISTALILSACGVVEKVRDDISESQKSGKQTFSAPMQIAPQSRVTEIKRKIIPATTVTNIRTHDWLAGIKVELKVDNPTPLSAVIEKLSAQGLNIVSDLPLNSYTYTGRVSRTDAEAALKTILGSVGLDYQTDDVRKLVMIKPMTSRSWFLNIGNRRSSYSSDNGTTSSTSSSTNNTGTSGTGSTTNSFLTAGTGTTGGSSSGTNSQNNNSSSSSSNSGNGTGVSSADDFWTSLSNELKSRLTVLMPRGAAGSIGSLPLPGIQNIPSPGMPIPAIGMQQTMPTRSNNSADQSGANALYVSRQIGSYSLNAETGAITVQAPHWILEDMDVYIKGVQEMYNTDITFTGELVLVTSNKKDSEGFDITTFATWASGKYAAVISNNALGGVTVSMPDGATVPTVTAGSPAISGPLYGMQYSGANTAMQIFNAYLSEVGEVSVIQRPLITTTSGVPGVFSKKYTDYYNTISQQAAAGGTGSAATATQNTIVGIDLGTELRINPRIDIATGLIRAQITLNQAIQSGTKNVPQTITYGNNSKSVDTSIPLVTRQNLSGEILLRDGDLIVVGGQTEDNLAIDESGIPGKNGPMGGIFGVKTAKRGAQTYYFALRVVVSKRK